MSDRKKLQDELNRVNELYQQYDLDLRKAGGDIGQRQQMRDLLNAKKKSLMEELGDDLTDLNMGKAKTIAGAAKSPASKMVLKKLMGVVPLMGAGAALMSGDPAMAAEELASDAAGPAGQLYEAIKPDVAGNLEEEKEMLAERNAKNKYENSPAARNARVARGEIADPPIGGDRFAGLTGQDIRQPRTDKIIEADKKLAGDDEQKLKKLRQMMALSGVKHSND